MLVLGSLALSHPAALIAARPLAVRAAKLTTQNDVLSIVISSRGCYNLKTKNINMPKNIDRHEHLVGLQYLDMHLRRASFFVVRRIDFLIKSYVEPNVMSWVIIPDGRRQSRTGWRLHNNVIERRIPKHCKKSKRP